MSARNTKIRLPVTIFETRIGDRRMLGAVIMGGRFFVFFFHLREIIFKFVTFNFSRYFALCYKSHISKLAPNYGNNFTSILLHGALALHQARVGRSASGVQEVLVLR